MYVCVYVCMYVHMYVLCITVLHNCVILMHGQTFCMGWRESICPHYSPCANIYKSLGDNSQVIYAKNTHVSYRPGQLIDLIDNRDY